MRKRHQDISCVELEELTTAMRDITAHPIDSVERAEQMQALTMIRDPELRCALGLPTIH